MKRSGIPFFLSRRAFGGRAKKDSVAETAKIAKTEGVSLENLDLVVEALGKGVCIWTVKRVDDG